MSSRRTRGPAHQNAFAFRHNPKSKLTAKIMAAPNEGLCQRCHDKVEWRKKYRKYKPLSAPACCNVCRQKTVRAAYHTCCQKCATEKGVCAWCQEKRPLGKTDSAGVEAERAKLEKQLEGVHLRKKRSMLRAFDRSNGLVKPSEEDIAKAAAMGDDDDEGFSDFDDDDEDFDDDFGDDDDDLCLDDDPLERALSRMAVNAAKGGPGLLKDHGGAAEGGKVSSAEEEEEEEAGEGEEEEEEEVEEGGQESR